MVKSVQRSFDKASLLKVSREESKTPSRIHNVVESSSGYKAFDRSFFYGSNLRIKFFLYAEKRLSIRYSNLILDLKRLYIQRCIYLYTLQSMGSFINHVDRFLDIFDPPSPLCGQFYLIRLM